MDKKFVDGLKQGLGFLTIFLVAFSVYAVGFHQTSEIVPGIFQGDYSFKGEVNFSKANVSGISQVSKGLIAAFNGSCPDGWENVPGINGRVIIGNGSLNSNNYNLGNSGGNLTHQHASPSPTYGSTGSGGMSTIHEGSWPYGIRDVSPSFTVERDEVLKTTSSRTQVYQTSDEKNVQPYIVLNWCRKK